MPNAPSATALNIAKALINDRDVEIKITGIRPGEKMHEILVSEEEINHCITRGDYYVIRPMLPELIDENDQEQNVMKKEFSSEDRVLDLEGTVTLLKNHFLMVEDQNFKMGRELLR